MNRQFLFQRKHIGLPKAQVAKESALRFNPTAKIIAHHANIKNPEFGSSFFKKFDIVMNALDNLDARRHVNRVCVATEQPLIESGTAGYLGQVQLIKRGVTECYECQPKPTPKTYAYCTIRSSPTKPIHCVIWAKEEFKTHFGDPADVIKEDEEPVDDSEIAKEEAVLSSKKQNFAEWLFHKLFHTDIFKKVRVAELTGKDLWSGRQPPLPLSLDLLHFSLQHSNNNTHHNGPSSVEILPDQIVWTLQQNIQNFLLSVQRLQGRVKTGNFLEFDKDDNDSLDFVTSASNIRSHIFNIPLQSKFAVKSAAGNIIPAIATTNAIIAGMIVMEAFKLLQGQIQNSGMIYLKKVPIGGRLLVTEISSAPNPNCYVCGSHFLSVKINTNTATLELFVEKVLKEKLALNEPSIILDSDIVYECGEGLEAYEWEQYSKQAKKYLTQVRIANNCILEVNDNSQDLKLQLNVLHCDSFEEDKMFEIMGEISKEQPQVQVDSSKAPKPTASPVDSSSASNDVMILETTPSIASAKKRKRANSNDRNNGNYGGTKKSKQEQLPPSNSANTNSNNNNSSAVIELD